MDNKADSGILYTYPGNFRAYKGMIAAKYSGFKLEIAEDFQLGVSNITDEFLAQFPLGQLPALKCNNGLCITEGNAIAWMVANEQLRGKNCMDQAKILQWINYADNEILPASSTWVFPCLGIMPFIMTKAEQAREDVKKALSYLNNHLLTRTYLVGERVTLADISVACTLLSLYEHMLEPTFRDVFKNTNRWFKTVINQPEAKAVIGEFKLCEKMAQFDKKNFADMQEKIKKMDPERSQKQKEKKDNKEKSETKKNKEQSHNTQPAETPVVPKPKDPLDILPAGSFDMEAWKRFYSNNEEGKSVAYFWENFDKENYSIWFSEYKYPEDLTKIFMTCNLVSGMFQRLDKMRKNSFASMCVFGEDKKNNISGIWIWRGHELAFPLCSDWSIDYESFDWRKLDANSDEAKKLVDQYFKWEGDDHKGRKFNQGKIFK